MERENARCSLTIPSVLFVGCERNASKCRLFSPSGLNERFSIQLCIITTRTHAKH